MEQFSATDAALSGFRLAREHLKTVGVWVAIMAVVSFVITLIAVTSFGAQLTALLEVSNQPTPDPEQTMAAMRGMWPLFLGLVVYVLALNAVLMAGVNRLILRPQDSASAYLRLGGDELRQVAVQIVVNLVLFVAYFVAGLVAAVIVGIGVAIGGAALGILLGLAAGIALISLLVFLSVRLSLTSALTFETRRIDLRAAWTLTKGQFWPMFGAYFIAIVLAAVVYLLLFVIIAAVAMAMGGGLAGAGDTLHQDIESLSTLLTPSGVVRSVLSGVTSVLLSLIAFAPAPTIYAQLRGRNVTDTFG